EVHPAAPVAQACVQRLVGRLLVVHRHDDVETGVRHAPRWRLRAPSRTLPCRMRLRAAAATLALSVAVACRTPEPSDPTAPAPAASAAVETREVQLDDDFITVRLHIPDRK